MIEAPREYLDLPGDCWITLKILTSNRLGIYGYWRIPARVKSSSREFPISLVG
jgi:hypothetical protein